MSNYLILLALVYLAMCAVEALGARLLRKKDSSPRYLLRTPAEISHVGGRHCRPSEDWRESAEMREARRQAAAMLAAIKGKGAPKA